MYKLKKNKLKAKGNQSDYIVKDEGLKEVGEGWKKRSMDGEKQIVIKMKKNKNKDTKEETAVDKGKLLTEPIR